MDLHTNVRATLAAKAFQNDFHLHNLSFFMKRFVSKSQLLPQEASHFRYLSEELFALSTVNDGIPSIVKDDMVKTIKWS